jgi:hypothetical protein
MSIDARTDPRFDNNIDFFRLLAAVGVVFGHALVFSGAVGLVLWFPLRHVVVAGSGPAAVFVLLWISSDDKYSQDSHARYRSLWRLFLRGVSLVRSNPADACLERTQERLVRVPDITGLVPAKRILGKAARRTMLAASEFDCQNQQLRQPHSCFVAFLCSLLTRHFSLHPPPFSPPPVRPPALSTAFIPKAIS